MGQITILPGHIPLVANLVAGELHAKTDHDDFYLFVAGGFVQVRPGNKVVILADDAEHHYAIDVQKAEEAHERARKAMAEKQVSSQDYARIAASLQQNAARITIARRHAHRHNPMAGKGNYNE